MNVIEDGRRQLTPDELMHEARSSEARARDAWDSDPRKRHRELMAASDFALRAARAYPKTPDHIEHVSDAVVEGVRLLGLDGNDELVVEKGSEVLGYFRGRLTGSAEDDINGMIDFSQKRITPDSPETSDDLEDVLQLEKSID